MWDFVSYLVPMSLAIILFKLADLAPLFDNGAAGALVLLFLLFGMSMVRGRGGLEEVAVPRALGYPINSSSTLGACCFHSRSRCFVTSVEAGHKYRVCVQKAIRCVLRCS